jgi:tetratricopeptide (TPR) repeat protein
MKKLFFVFLMASIWIGCGTGGNKEAVEDDFHPDPMINELTQQLSKNPSDATLWVARAQAFYDKGGYDEAIADMSSAMRIDSTNIEYHHILADIYIGYYKSRMALTTLQRAAVLHPRDIPTLIKLAELQTILTFHDESMATLDKVMRIDPENVDALVIGGLNFEAQGDTARAIGSYQKAVQIDPEKADAWIKLAKLRAARKEKNALDFFNTAIKVAPDDVVPMMAKADYLWDTERYADAVEVYQEVIEKHPSHTDAYYNLGLVYMEVEQWQEAYDHFNLTVQMNPLYFKAFFYRGVASEQLGNLELALKDYDQASRMAPNFEKAADAYELLSRKMKQ